MASPFSTNLCLQVTSPRVDASLSGATLTLSVLRESRLITAWVGDSRAVLARRAPATDAAVVDEHSNAKPKVVAYDLTVDHKPTLPAEHQRIIDAGGRVQQLVVRYVGFSSCYHY